MPNVRIKDQTTDTALTTGDYVIVDSESEGTRKYDLGALAERVEALEQGGSGLTQAEKQLILTLFCKAAYAEDDAGVVYDALEALWATTTRTITYNLSHVSSSNTTASIEQGQSYTTTLTATGSYTLNTVTVTMGGVDITSTSYTSGTVSIASVTGNIVITATAESTTAAYPLTSGSVTFTNTNYPGELTVVAGTPNTVTIESTGAANSTRRHVCVSDLSNNSDSLYNYNADSVATEWFSLAEGDVVRVVLTKDSFTSTSGSEPSNYGIYFTTTASSTKTYFALADATSTSGDTYEATKTLESALSVGALGAFCALGSTAFTITMSFKVYVNGTRWI